MTATQHSGYAHLPLVALASTVGLNLCNPPPTFYAPNSLLCIFYYQACKQIELDFFFAVLSLH